MNDKTQAMLYLAAAGAIFLIASKLLAKPRSKALEKAQRIACLGDSLTAGGIYASDLAGILGVEVKAFGYASQGTAYILNQVDDVLAWKPDAVVVLAGVNDLPGANGANIAINGLSRIYQKLQLANVMVVAVEITPWHGYPSAVGHEVNTDTVNRWIRQEANVSAVVRTSSLGDYRGNLKDKYSAGDGLHLNREGQAQLAVLIADQAFGR
jgi:lysophospholipase L1-like esterase